MSSDILVKVGKSGEAITYILVKVGQSGEAITYMLVKVGKVEGECIHAG